MHDVFRIQAIHPRSGEIEPAWLFEDHFGPKRHAIRFDRDGPNAACHAASKIPWEPIPARKPETPTP